MIAFHHYKTPRVRQLLFWFITAMILVGLALSFMSWLEICVEHCSANRDFRLFGIPFAYVGITYFTLLLLAHLLSRTRPSFVFITAGLLLSGLGAEVMFILVQKYQIGHWCPVCLSIAGALLCAAIAFLLANFIFQSSNQGRTIMDKIKRNLGFFAFFALGFVLAFSGISKVDQLQASVEHIKGNIEFGNKSSPIELYYFTDWFCPSCKKVDPRIEALLPKIQSKVGFYFIDFPVHAKSMNFTPYNLAFMINDKPHYFKARKALEQLAQEKDAPTDEDIDEVAKKNGLKFHELPYLDVRVALEFFNKISEKYKLNSTPTLIILNNRSGKITRLEGTQEITEKEVLKAIEKMEEQNK